MLALLTGLWNTVKYIMGLVFPIFAKAGSIKGIGTGVRWVIHIIIVAAILVGLFFLNEYLKVGELIPRNPILRMFFLPILFLLVYIVCWLGWWLWKLLTEEEASQFPDIDAAWAEAMAALHQADIDLKEVPLFLVIGRPASSEHALFKATGAEWLVDQVPQNPEAPIHVYADRQAVWVTCAKASLLGKRAVDLAAGLDAGDGPSIDQSVRGSVSEGDDPLMQSLRGGEVFGSLRGGSVRKVQAVLANARKEGRDSLSGDERQAVYSMLPGKGGRGYSRDEFETERLTARLEHLCQVIVRDRRPFCHVNGILVLIPYAAAGSDGAADRTADDCRRDLQTARRILKTYCPVYTLVCDLEKASGFREFIDGFVAAHSKDHLKGRMGKHFPLIPDVSGGDVGQSIATFVQWICAAHFPGLVYRLFRLEGGEGQDLKTVVQSNARLYRFVGDISERQARLGRIIGKCLPAAQSGPPMFGGCYFAGTGREKDREQAFVAGIFHRLLEDQNYVAWSDDAWAEEAAFQRWARMGYIVLGVLGLAALGAVGWYFWDKR